VGGAEGEMVLIAPEKKVKPGSPIHWTASAAQPAGSQQLAESI